MKENIYFTLKLKTRTALHLGSGAGSDTSDALIRRDDNGIPLFPATSFAGALRTLLTRLAPRLGLDENVCQAITDENGEATCGCLVCGLLGDITPRDTNEIKAEASHLLIFNGKPEGDIIASIRDGVGIQRATGAAARAGGVNFDLEVLPPEAVFTVRMELRDGSPQQEKLLAAGLGEWQAGRGWLGGRVNRGLGAFQLETVEVGASDFENADQLVAYLKEDNPFEHAVRVDGWLLKQVGSIKPVNTQEKYLPYLASRWLEIAGTLRADGPLLTNDAGSADLSGFDHAPLLANSMDWQNPVLGGAGIRGVIRSHAERIARTLASLKAENEDNPKEAFQKICPACDPTENRPREALASCDALLRGDNDPDDPMPKILPEEQEATDEHLCLACHLFGSTRRGSRLIVEDAPFDEANGKPIYKMFDFLAIDRFTGGGADQFKFDALALWNPAFKLRIHLENPASWELGWLMLVLRDLQDGWLHLGMGAAKGFGKVRLEKLNLKLGYLTPEDLVDLKVDPDGKQTDSIYSEMNVTWEKAGTWVSDFHTQGIERSKTAEYLPQLKKDTYFGVVDNLYPIKVVTK